MKDLNNYITEKILINKDTKILINKDTTIYSCRPKDWDELRHIITERLAQDKNADLNDIDVSKITDMSHLFYRLDPHIINISDWDVRNVEYMNHMFKGCYNFTCDLNNWDVRNVKSTYEMFCNCDVFNSDLCNWTFKQIKNMNRMFIGCKLFTGKGLETWQINKNVSKKYMFNQCYSLKNKPSWYRR